MFTQCHHLSAIIFSFCSVCCSKWAELANRSRKLSARFGSRFLRELLRAARRSKSVRHVSELIAAPTQSAHKWLSQKPGSRLPLLSTRLTITFPATEHHHPLASIKLYCLTTETHVCEQLAQSRYMKVEWPRVQPVTSSRWVWCHQCSLHSTQPWSLHSTQHCYTRSCVWC